MENIKRIQQTDAKGVQVKLWLSGKGDLIGIVQTTKILTYRQMVNTHSRISPGEQNSQYFLEF